MNHETMPSDPNVDIRDNVAVTYGSFEMADLRIAELKVRAANAAFDGQPVRMDREEFVFLHSRGEITSAWERQHDFTFRGVAVELVKDASSE